jgi:hypothetical protein
MKYLIIICALLTACTSLKKTINRQKQDVTKSVFSVRDSIGRLTVDSTYTKIISGWKAVTFDSGYDKVTEEEVKEVVDSGIIRRETKRTIKEKGQKRVEQLSSITRQDSGSKKIDQQGSVKEVQKLDSSGVTVAQQKNVNRTSFMPWWIWFIVAGVAVLAWWKRNPIIDFLTPNNKNET